MINKIYLDNAATTPQNKKITEAMNPYFSKIFGNASSIHTFGQEALVATDNSREKVAKYFNCRPNEVIFTSGATESNNLAIKGIVGASKIKKPHVITTSIEHHSVLETIEFLHNKGLIEATFIPVNREGIVSPDKIIKAVNENTVLISVMYVNNEIGTIQPLLEISKKLATINKKRGQDKKDPIYFHTDAVQAIGYLDCNINTLNLDLISLSAHKFYGPKGIGALIVKEGTNIEPQMIGGAQEYKLRAGTLNVPSIVGFGKAIELLKDGNWKDHITKIKKLRDKLKDGILKSIPDVQINGSVDSRIHGNINMGFKKIEGESILLALDFEGIAASTGSACASGSLSPSHVLLALGLPPEEAHGSIRFSLGAENTEEEIDKVLEVLPKIVQNLRNISPIK